MPSPWACTAGSFNCAASWRFSRGGRCRRDRVRAAPRGANSDPRGSASPRSNSTLVIDYVAPCLIGPAAGLIIIARGGRASDGENRQLTCQCAKDRELRR
ncbi:hypothetical protein MRX96_003656 [Rhipicephalus microplus]